MRKPLISVLVVALLIAATSGCAGIGPPPVTVDTPSPSLPTSPEALSSPPPDASSIATDQIVGTLVRFSSGRTTVDVTIGQDSPTVRDFLSLLPAQVTFEDLNGREKIGYFDRELTIDGSPGSDPVDGDLIYFSPWGNLGFYYNADGIGYSDATIHIGTYTATADQLALLEGSPVTIEVIDG